MSKQDERKFVVHPLPASFGKDRFPAHKRGDTSCPTCAHEADLERQLAAAKEKLDAVEVELRRPNKRLHHYDKDIHRSDCGACGLLRILKEGTYAKTHAKCDLCVNGVLLVGGGLQRCPKEGE